MEQVARDQAARGRAALADTFSDAQNDVLKEKPGLKIPFTGSAVHKETARQLEKLLPGEYTYHGVGPDFTHAPTGTQIELTTPGQVEAHKARPNPDYQSCQYATYDIPARGTRHPLECRCLYRVYSFLEDNVSGRILEAEDSCGATLSFGYDEDAHNEDWSGYRLGRLRSGVRVSNSRFDRVTVRQFPLGGRFAEFVDCSFDGARLTSIYGTARFIRCSFRGARITDFTVNPLGLIDCDFRDAKLRRCLFYGAPTPHMLQEEPDLPPLNEFHGNDFSTARFDDSDFRFGVDLTQQKLPNSPDYALALDGKAALQRGNALLDHWEAEGRDVKRARNSLNTLAEKLDRGQEQLFVTHLTKRMTPEEWLESRPIFQGHTQ